MSNKTYDFIREKIARVPVTADHSGNAETARHILMAGWSGIYVGDAAMSFEYTIGMTEIALPELIVFGLPYRQSHMILHNAAKQMRAGGKPADGWRAGGVLESHQVAFQTLPSFVLTEFACQAAFYYEPRPVEVMQVVWPDAAGRFPWDHDCTPEYARRQSQVIHWV
jgi:hypothetical protein